MRRVVHLVAIVAGLLVTLAALGLLLRWTLPFTGAPRLWRLDDYIEPGNAVEKAALVQAQVQATAVLVQILGGLLLVGTIYTAIHSVRQAQQGLELSREQLRIAQDQLRDEAETNREQLRIAQEGQITERFTRAVEMLAATDDHGNSRLEIRVGGIYALERVARDSPRDHEVVFEVLCAYVRNNSRCPDRLDPKPFDGPRGRPDIQAILTVIARRALWLGNGESHPLNLSGTDLRGFVVDGAHLEQCNLDESDLSHARFANAILDGASFALTELSFTNLTGASLRDTLILGDWGLAYGLEPSKLEGARIDPLTILPYELQGRLPGYEQHGRWGGVFEDFWSHLRAHSRKESQEAEATGEAATEPNPW